MTRASSNDVTRRDVLASAALGGRLCSRAAPARRPHRQMPFFANIDWSEVRRCLEEAQRMSTMHRGAAS